MTGRLPDLLTLRSTDGGQMDRSLKSLGLDSYHLGWDNSIEPRLTVSSGDRIQIDSLDASGGQIPRDGTALHVSSMDFSRLNPVTGPIFVEGAEPGDAIKVSFESLEVADWGWTGTIAGFGLLADDFPESSCFISKVGDMSVELPFGPVLPKIPMIGTIGVALAEPGIHSIVPPSIHGGNMDIRDLGEGSTLLLPVAVPGALLSVGDPHAAMGDGEVCGTGVETTATSVIRVELVKGAAPRSPVIESSGISQRTGASLLTTGIGPDLHRASIDAIRSMIDELVRRTGLAPLEAYVLCSLTVDLKVSELVDAPNWVVSAHIPLSVIR